MENKTNKDLDIALSAFKAEDYEKAVNAFLCLLQSDQNNPNI